MRSQNYPLPGVGVLVWRQQQLLLGQRLMPDAGHCWQFPGGHLEAGESVIDCAARELSEETGLRASAFRHLGFTDRVFSVNGRDYITLLVSCEYDGGEAVVHEPEKCAGWQWFDYRRLPAPLFTPIELFLAQCADLYHLHRSVPVPARRQADGHR